MKSSRETGRRRRHERVRKRILGTAERARLTVFRSHLHIYAQIVDDTKGRTLVAASSLKLGSLQPGEGETRQITQAKAVGVTLVWSGVVAFIAYKIADIIVGLRVPEEQEREGLDITAHGFSKPLRPVIRRLKSLRLPSLHCTKSLST